MWRIDDNGHLFPRSPPYKERWQKDKVVGITGVQECHAFSQYHFVEAGYKVRIEESTMKNRQAHYASNELEVTPVIRIDCRSRV